MKNLLTVLLLALVFGGLGCKKDPITVTRIPKETMGSGQSNLHWKTPAQWQELPASGMRVGSFKASGLDISIVTLSGSAGSILANVNRWRGQIGLKSISNKQLNIKKKGSFSIVFIEGKDQSILAAILNDAHKTTFIKMMGETTSVKKEKKVFLSFLESIHFD